MDKDSKGGELKLVKTKKKPRGGNSPVIGDNGVMTEPGDNAKYATVARAVASWSKVERSDIAALEKRLDEYIELCIQNDMKIGNQGCYFALGIDKYTVYDWENGRSGTPAHSNFIKKVKEICSFYRESLMQDGKINPITGIFWQKNYDGLHDKQEVVLTPNNPLGDLKDPEEIRRRYLDALPSGDSGD